MEEKNNSNIVDNDTQNKMEEIWRETCGSWDDCNKTNVHFF